MIIAFIFFYQIVYIKMGIYVLDKKIVEYVEYTFDNSIWKVYIWTVCQFYAQIWGIY